MGLLDRADPRVGLPSRLDGEAKPRVGSVSVLKLAREK